MKRIVVVLLVSLVFMGCKGSKGDTGSPGAGGSITTYTGSVPNSGSVSFPPASSSAIVLGYISLTGTCCWELLSGSSSANQWFSANNEAGFGQFFNSSGDFYKIVVIIPASASRLP